MLLRKPTSAHPPEAHAMWSKFASEVASGKYPAEKRITPHSVPQIGVTHNLKDTPKKSSDTNYNGTVWAGAGKNTGGRWNAIFGSWTIPTVSQPPQTQGSEGGWNSSSWIGLDGMFTSDDVLQAGIQQRVSPSGQASYVPWYEWYAPQVAGSPPYIYQTNISNFAAAPGQAVSCTVSYVGTTAGQIAFSNKMTGQYFSITLAPPPGATFNGSSVEWIMEAPDGGAPTSSLPAFTPVVFTGCIACNSAANTTIAPGACDTMNITAANGQVLTNVVDNAASCTISFAGSVGIPTGG